VSGRSQVEDGQAAESEPDVAREVVPEVVGAAMRDDVGHPRERARVGPIAVERDDASQAAHYGAGKGLEARAPILARWEPATTEGSGGK
jgi:hypothetical protein